MNATLTQEQIRATLQLDDLYSVGDALESMIRMYRAGNHKEFDAQSHLPKFMLEAMGPQLERLASYTIAKNRASTPHLVVSKASPGGIPGLGDPLEEAHSDMRKVGAAIGKLVAPALKGQISANAMNGKKFEPEEIGGLLKLESTTLQLSADLPPLPILRKDFVQKAFLMGAEARAHVSRTAEEKDILKSNVGTLKESYVKLLDLLYTIHMSMKQHPSYENKTLADFNLRPDPIKMADALATRQQQFSTLYNYLYIVNEGMLTKPMENLKWAIEGIERPASGVKITTPKEAAAALAGLYDMLSFRENFNTTHAQDYKKIAGATPTEAARIIEGSRMISELRNLGKISDKPRANVIIKEILPDLETFVSNNRPGHASNDQSMLNRMAAERAARYLPRIIAR